MGAILLVQPFLMPWSPWSWTPATEADLVGADINADLTSLNEQGLILQMQGDRPISVILPPIRWRSDSPPVMRVTFCLEEPPRPVPPPLDRTEGRLRIPEVDSPGASIFVRLLWQELPGAAYRYIQQTVSGSEIVRSVDLPMPVVPDRVHRAGVQLVGVEAPLQSVRLVAIELPDLSRAQRVAMAWRSFTEPEPIANHSVNFLRGPTILGRSLNWMLLAFVLTLIGLAGAWAAARRRPFSRLAWFAPLLVAWFVVDGWATWNLARQARGERETFASLAPEEKLARVWGEDIAWAAEALRRRAPPGATYAVIADDPFYPAHRLDYLLAPTFRGVENPAQADYIAVIHATGERLEAALNPNSSFERVASKDSDVFLLGRRVAR